MYRDEILDLYKNPRNTGSIDDGLHAEGDNPSCGDHTDLYVKVEDGEIVDIRHETEGCAVSTAATSIVTEELVGMSPGKALELDRDWMLEELDIELSPMRVKCGMLGLKTVQKALKERD
jgi:nitrogen fixation NifU-like protein